MPYTTWLRRIIIVGLFGLFITPFIVANGALVPSLFFPYVTGKAFFFRIIVELLFGAYILLALAEPKYRPKRSLLFWTVLALVGWMGLSTIFSLDPSKSFWSNFERMEGYVGLLHLAAYFIVATSVLAKEDWKNILRVSVGAGVVMGFYGILQHLGWLSISTQSGVRVDGTFGNAAYMAVFLLINTGIAAALAVVPSIRKGERWIFAVSALIMSLAMFFTQTRGSLLGLVAGVVVAGFVLLVGARGEGAVRVRKFGMILAVGVVGLIGGVFLLRNTSFVQHNETLQRMASISLTERTTESRFMIWGMALEGFKEHPVLGWGMENFSYVFNSHYTPEMYDQEMWFDRAHDQFLDWLVAGGLPAFALYAMLFALAVVAFAQSKELSIHEKAIWIALLAAYAVHITFVFDNLMSAVLFMLVLAYAAHLSPHKNLLGAVGRKGLSPQTVAAIAPIVVIATLFVVWSVNAPAIARSTALLDALQTKALSSTGAVVSRSPAQILAAYDTAFNGTLWPHTALGQQEVGEQFFQYVAGTLAATSGETDAKTKALTQAQTYITTLAASRPNDARLELFSGIVMQSFGEGQKALDYYTAALKDSPKKQLILDQVGSLLLSANQTDEALQVFKQSFELEPRNTTALGWYAFALYATGQSAAADATILAETNSKVLDDDRLLSLFTQMKQYDRVVAIWNVRVEKDPTNPEYQAQLARAYYYAGDKARAIKILETLAAAQPTLKSQIDPLIEEIKNNSL